MNLTVTGDAFNVTGNFYNHVTSSDPNSALNPAAISSLTFSGSLLNSDPSALHLNNPGEVGVIVMGGESISLPDNVGVSITNFRTPSTVPEPSSVLLFGTVAALVANAFRRRFA